MPPPAAVNQWLTARRFGVVIDAGSSGSRLQIYSWKDPRVAVGALDTLPKVEKGTRDGEEWSMKVEPGISSFADNVNDIASYLDPLIQHAQSHVPPSSQSETPIFFLATAGMRLLSPPQQADVLQATCNYLRAHSNFRLGDPSSAGPCGSSVRIITGEEEGLFGWIAVNYLMDGFTGHLEDHLTYGFLDMGGASTQIAFEPSEEEREKSQNLLEVRLRLLDGREVHHKVFVTTWLGYGTNQARERYVEQTIIDYESTHPSTPMQEEESVPDPCLPKDLQLTEASIQLGTFGSHPKSHTLVGTGSFEQCLQRILPLLNKDAPCPDTHCLFNGVYVPSIDFFASHFIGISEYWYSSEHVFGLGGAYDVVQYERAASEFCSREWSDILRQHEHSRDSTGSGDIGGQAAGTVHWGEQVEIPRLQMQCFKAAWIVNVLHEGIGLPRIVDPGGNSTGQGDAVEKQADKKGLGKPLFQSMDNIGDTAISWTLGKMVLEASKEVPRQSKTDLPIVDPLDDPANTDITPIKPIHPSFFDFDAIEDHLSGHLPASFTRRSLGFSFIAFLFYSIIISMLFFIIYRLRHRFRSLMCRHTHRKDDIFESYSMEEGKSLYRTSRLPNPWAAASNTLSFPIFRPFKTLLAALPPRRSQPRRPPPINVMSVTPSRDFTSPARVSPLRSYSLPVMKGANGLTAVDTGNGAVTAYNVVGSPRHTDGSITPNGSLYSLTSRSRNSSQMNLSSLTPRQTISRTSVNSHTPLGTIFLDE